MRGGGVEIRICLFPGGGVEISKFLFPGGGGVEISTAYIKTCTTNHSSVTILIICVYVLNKNTHTEFKLPSMFQS